MTLDHSFMLILGAFTTLWSSSFACQLWSS